MVPRDDAYQVSSKSDENFLTSSAERRTDTVKPIYFPFIFVGGGIKIALSIKSKKKRFIQF